MSSNVVRCHKHDCFQRLNRERRRREVNERKERRYVRQKGKSLRIRHQKKSRRAGKTKPCRTEGAGAPCLLMPSAFYSKTFIRPVFRLDMWNFMDYETRPLQAAHILYPCVTSVAVCPVIVFKSNLDCRRILFRENFPRRSRKENFHEKIRQMRPARQIRFSFDEGENCIANKPIWKFRAGSFSCKGSGG